MPRSRDLRRRIEIDDLSPSHASNPIKTAKMTPNPTSRPTMVEDAHASEIPPRCERTGHGIRHGSVPVLEKRMG